MKTMLDLPDELIDDIFSRVPSESVRAARSTCKAWNALFYRWFAKKMEEPSDKECWPLVWPYVPSKTHRSSSEKRQYDNKRIRHKDMII
ncbi:unnamed protein product [Brassica oleracea var. botrytis]